jgi:aspartate aminotransferase
MITISQRGINMPSSPIRKLSSFAEAAKKEGVKVYHLNIGQPDIETPSVMMEAVHQASLKVLEYTDSAGILSFRKKLAQYYQSKNIDVDYEDILITIGGSEGILFAFMACLDVGDEIIVPEPFYANYIGFAMAAGIHIVPITSTIESGFALPPIASFKEKITTKTKGIFICNPNNPTGYVYSEKELLQIRDLIKEHDLYLFSDEAYTEFSYEGKVKSTLTLLGVEDRVIMIDTFSKKYSACGARIGALVTKNKLVIEAVMKFAQARLSPPTLEQIAAEAALNLPNNYFEETRKEYQHRREVLINRLQKMKGVYCPTPNGAFYVMAKLPVAHTDHFCQWLLTHFRYQNATLMLAPGSGFYTTPGLGNQEVRLAYVIHVEAINAAMDCLEQALLEYSIWSHS